MKTILFVVVLFFAFACEKDKQDAGSDNQNIEMASKLFEAFNQHNWNAYAEAYAPDADFLDPSYGKAYVKQTRQKLIEKYAGVQKAIPDIRDSLIAIYGVNENVIVEFISKGTLPDGTKWQLPICTVLTFKGGKIIKDATYFDEEK